LLEERKATPTSNVMEIKFKTKWRPILKDKKRKRLKC